MENPTVPTLKKFLSELPEGEATVLSITEALTKDGKPRAELIVGRRKLQPEEAKEAPRAESAMRAHVFHDVAGFVRYLKGYGSKDTVIFANVPANRVGAILDERATKGFENVAFVPQLHPKWSPWEGLLDKEVPLGDFVDFIRQNRRTVVNPEGRQLALALSQVQASTEITLHKGSGRTSLNGLLVKTRIQGQDKEEVVELPEVITLDVPIFVRTEPKKIELDLILETANAGTAIVCRVSSGDLREAKIEAFEEMLKEMEKLAAPVPDEKRAEGVRLTITYGQFGEQDWDRVS